MVEAIARLYYLPVPDDESKSCLPPTQDNYLSAGLASQRHLQDHLGLFKRGSKPAGSGAKSDPKNRHQKRGARTRMACGFCRKRKIKCTGETPDGEPCSSCRSSGHTPCDYSPPGSKILMTDLNCARPCPPTAQRHPTLQSKVTKPRPPNLCLPAHVRTSPYDLAAVGLHAASRQGLPSYEHDPSAMYNMHLPIYTVSGNSPSAAQFDYIVPVWGPTSTPLNFSLASPSKTSHEVSVFGTTNPENSLAGSSPPAGLVDPAIKTEDEWLANSPFSPTTSITSYGSTTSAETYPCPPTPFSTTSATTSTISGDHKPSQPSNLTTPSEMMFGYSPTTTTTTMTSSSICSPASAALCSSQGVFGLHPANELQTASSSDGTEFIPVCTAASTSTIIPSSSATSTRYDIGRLVSFANCSPADMYGVGYDNINSDEMIRSHHLQQQQLQSGSSSTVQVAFAYHP